jgi:hypothetical protein
MTKKIDILDYADKLYLLTKEIVSVNLGRLGVGKNRYKNQEEGGYFYERGRRQ